MTLEVMPAHFVVVYVGHFFGGFLGLGNKKCVKQYVKHLHVLQFGMFPRKETHLARSMMFRGIKKCDESGYWMRTIVHPFKEKMKHRARTSHISYCTWSIWIIEMTRAAILFLLVQFGVVCHIDSTPSGHVDTKDATRSPRYLSFVVVCLLF